MGNLILITKCCAEPKNENENEDINNNNQPIIKDNLKTLERSISFLTVID